MSRRARSRKAPPLEVSWFEVTRYLDSLHEVESGRRLTLVKALKYLLFHSFLETLEPGERRLMRELESQLRADGSRRRS